MSLYTLPDIPATATPDWRRFCEQVRTFVAEVETFGQYFEVHEAITAAPSYNATLILDEFPVYRSDGSVELLYATWTVPFSQNVRHDITLSRRAGDGAADPTILALISSASAVTTAWVANKPKRFTERSQGRRLSSGQILTLSIEEIIAAGNEPWGLLSMYFRRVEPH